MEHINFDIVYTSHTPFETLHWCVSMAVKLHAHWSKHLLNAKFSCREHCWWPTSRICVNTLINETVVKREATTLSVWHRRALQHMSASRKSPTTGAHLRGLPLSAFIVSLSLHYLPKCLRSTVTCHAAKRLPPWLEVHLRRFVAMLLFRKQNPISQVSKPAPEGIEADLVNCKLVAACYQNSEPDSCAVWVSY